jgi:hypothetical protein
VNVHISQQMRKQGIRLQGQIWVKTTTTGVNTLFRCLMIGLLVHISALLASHVTKHQRGASSILDGRVAQC